MISPPSGWISGERAVLGKSLLAEARYGKGRVVLFGFRPQHRGQPFGTFKLLLNAIYLINDSALTFSVESLFFGTLLKIGKSKQ